MSSNKSNWGEEVLIQFPLTVPHLSECPTTIDVGTTRSHLHIDVYDWESEPIHQHFDTAIKFIDSHQRVLVHCGAGASRSPTIVLAWLMGKRGKSLRCSYDHVKAIRPFIQPNEGFMQQLIDFERRLFGSTSVCITEFDYGSD